jgi:signal transduction histidine kinase
VLDVDRPAEDPPTFSTRHAPALRTLLAPANRGEQFLLVAAFQVAGGLLTGWVVDRSVPPTPALVLLVAGPAFLLLPRPALVRAGGAGAVAVAYLVAGFPAWPVLAAPVLATLGAVLAGRLLPVVALALAGLVLYWTASVFGPKPVTADAVPEHLAWVGAALVFAAALRLHGEREEARAQVVAEYRRHRATAERLRIARNLHLSLSQQVSLMSTRARVARNLLVTSGWLRADEVATALDEISGAGVDVLAELRAVGGVLEEEGTRGVTRPTPGLTALPSLVRAHAEVGLTVRVEGSVTRLPRVVDQLAFLVVAEALGDIARNSTVAGATVNLDVARVAGTGHLVVTVSEDPGRGPLRTVPDTVGGAPGDGGTGRVLPTPVPRGDRLLAVRDGVEVLGGVLTMGAVTVARLGDHPDGAMDAGTPPPDGTGTRLREAPGGSAGTTDHTPGPAGPGPWRVRALLPLRLAGLPVG